MICRSCGSTLTSPDSKKDKAISVTCPNCGQENAAVIVGTNEHKPDDKGRQFNPFSVNNPLFTPVGISLAYNRRRIIESQLLTRKPKKKKYKAKDVFLSEEVKQCPDLLEINNKRKRNQIVDNSIEDINRICEDLAIDG